MKKLMACLIALALSPGALLFAQSIAGTWQGSLAVPQAPGGQLRVSLRSRPPTPTP